MRRLAVVIVDDEEPARHLLAELLARDDRFALSASCDGGKCAMDVIRESAPDLVLLDVQMPEVDGLDVLAALSAPLPAVIMVTAYSEYAVQAFDHHAVDYLLKPIDPGRFKRALDRVVERLSARSEGQDDGGVPGLIGSLRGRPSHHDRVTLKCGSSLLFLKPSELRWAEAAGNYLKLAVHDSTYLLRDTIAGLLDRLDPGAFVQIHRSFVVNSALVLELRPKTGGSDWCVVMRDGTELPLGRSFRAAVMHRLSNDGPA